MESNIAPSSEIDLPLRNDQAPRRRGDILAAAARSFALHGFRGSSLREIAKDASVSLTLANHYFGNKAMLLEAVVSSHHDECQRRIRKLKTLVQATSGSVSLARLIGEWVDYEFDLYQTRGGRHYLHLMLKLASDEEIDPTIRRGLNCSEAVIVNGIHCARPGLSEETVVGAWLLTSAALYAALLNSDELFDSVPACEMPDFRGLTERFLLGGLSAYLGEEEVLLDLPACIS